MTLTQLVVGSACLAVTAGISAAIWRAWRPKWWTR